MIEYTQHQNNTTTISHNTKAPEFKMDSHLERIIFRVQEFLQISIHTALIF